MTKNGGARHGTARHGTARHCRRGMARHGTARRGTEGMALHGTTALHGQRSTPLLPLHTANYNGLRHHGIPPPIQLRIAPRPSGYSETPKTTGHVGAMVEYARICSIRVFAYLPIRVFAFSRIRVCWRTHLGTNSCGPTSGPSF